MNIFRKWQLFFIYRKVIKQNITELSKHFTENQKDRTYFIKEIKIDSINRIYTVLNFQKNSKENIKTYGYMFMDNEVKKFITEISKELKKLGIEEFVALTKADNIGNDSIYIIMEYKFLNISKAVKQLLFILILISATLFTFFKT